MNAVADNLIDTLPLTSDDLERFRLRAHRRLPTSGLGTHLRRKLGQALDYREFREYRPGDDAKRIDWRASLRHGLANDRVVRTYEAEEQITVALSIDTRPSMFLPGLCPKIRVAGWLTQALGIIVSRERDRLLLHRLYSDQEEPVTAFTGGAAVTGSEDFASRLGAETPRTENEWQKELHLNAGSLLRALPPASALIILTDLYFDDRDGAFRDLLLRAQGGYRQVILVVLDSWPTERTLLSKGMHRLQGIEGAVLGTEPVEGSEDLVSDIDHRIREHYDSLLDSIKGGGLDWHVWRWPDESIGDSKHLDAWFRESFFDFAPFHSVFARR